MYHLLLALKPDNHLLREVKMDNISHLHSDIEVVAKQAFQSIASNKYNHLHLYLDGLKNHLAIEQTQKIIFFDANQSQSREISNA